jgi:hypothetical protein
LIGGIGLSYIAYAAIAAVWIYIRTGYYGISLQGLTIIDEKEWVFIYASFQIGYYLAYTAGFTCIVLALFRNKIVGKPKISA